MLYLSGGHILNVLLDATEPQIAVQLILEIIAMFCNSRHELVAGNCLHGLTNCCDFHINL